MREAEVFRALQLRDVNDLPGVIGHVLDHMRRSFVAGHIKLLNAAPLRQIVGIHARQDGTGFPHRLPQFFRQRLPRDRPAFVKLLVPLPKVRHAAQPGDNPLAHVAADMQHEITDAVRGFIRTPPDLVVGELLQASDDAWQVALLETGARFPREPM